MTVTVHMDARSDDSLRLAEEFWWSCECGQSAPRREPTVLTVVGQGLAHARSCTYGFPHFVKVSADIQQGGTIDP